MNYNRICLIGFVFFVFAITIQGAYAQTASFVTHQNFRGDIRSVYGADYSTYWPKLSDAESCFAREDVILQISPAGCQPTVVRSDLLAEQNVPVFCQIDALKINPLIDIKEIRNIRFTGNYPPEVAGIGFYPARAALKTQNRLLGDPLTNNIGYIVVVLKKVPNENEQPDFVNFTVRASIDYNTVGGFGIGAAQFLLKEQSDESFLSNDINRQTFWQGRYSVKLDGVDSSDAEISIYQGDSKINSVNVKSGETSREIYVPGLYCQAGLQVTYDGFVSGVDATARIAFDNDVVEVYEGSKFANDKCAVRKIDLVGKDFGSVEIACGSERAVLKLGYKEIKVGDSVIFDKDGEGFENKNRYVVTNIDGESYTLDGLDEVAKLYQIRPDSTDKLFEQVHNPNAEEYFKNSLISYELIADELAREKLPGEENLNTPFIGEKALVEAISLSRGFGKQFTEARLINKFIELYPDSQFAGDFRLRLGELHRKDTSLAGITLSLDNKVVSVTLLEVNQPDEIASAEFSWGRNNFLVFLKNSTSVAGLGNISLTAIDGPERVRVSVTCENQRDVRNKPYTLEFAKSIDEAPCGQSLNLREVNEQRLAKVRLLPRIKGTQSETNISVGIGIEKRAIELNPDKAKQRIDSLNETIDRWQGISDGLNNINKGLKTACFATAGILTAKNFFSGLSGEGLARQKVMNGYWTEECSDKEYDGKTYSSVNACYLDNADSINSDVSVMKGNLEEINSKIKSAESGENTLDSGGLFAEKMINTEGSVSELRREFDAYGNVQIDLGNGKSENLKDFIARANYSRRDINYDQFRDLMLNAELAQSDNPRLREIGQRNVDEIGKIVDSNIHLSEEVEKARNDRTTGLPPSSARLGVEDSNTIITPVSRIGSVTGINASGLNDGDATHVIRVSAIAKDLFDSGEYLVSAKELGSGSSGRYGAVNVYKKVSDGTYEKVQNVSGFLQAYNVGEIRASDSLSYSNPYLNYEVKFYETEPYKGLPAIVPFDIKNGWYAATEQGLPTFDRRGSFDSSGRVVSFWVCNVGEDGREQFFNNRGGDICMLVNDYAGQPTVFHGLSQQASASLINRAREALQEAARQYASGRNNIRIAGENIPIGMPAANIPQTQCQDFMSPQECQLMFNVCDPVICPASRCNFGGKYQVADVIQSGIVGSALLCLPNVQEGIAIPVCLTGIQAGIDGYLSILKSQQQCLQENVDSGRYVGICDAITSVYMCEFFWRQAAPLADTFVPKLFEIASGKGGARGGGEYLTVQNAWENAQGSVNFFTQHYAVNSLEAFKARSTAEAGSQFCRAFVSAKGPSTFDALVEPDSPPQFHAWFDAIKFSDATVPASSQYKVFFHIFSGKDTGVQYSVYLKDPPPNSFFTIPPIVQVASGFISRGAFATDTVDFTAPEGYKQLCVSVNGKEECGFKQVTTSFAVDALSNSFVSSEIDRSNIRSQDECISGGTNPTAFLNPNIQAGVEEALNPEVYNRGIVRICASRNPGSATDASRFKDVGYCGDTSIRCWLDQNSVDNAITSSDLGTRNATLSSLQSQANQQLVQNTQILREDEVNEGIEKIKGEQTKVNRNNIRDYLSLIDLTLEKTVLNYQKALLNFIKGNFYGKVANEERVGQVPVARDPGLGVEEADAVSGESKEETSGSSGTSNSVTSTGGAVVSSYVLRPEVHNDRQVQRIYSLSGDSSSPTPFFIFAGQIFYEGCEIDTRVGLAERTTSDEVAIIVPPVEEDSGAIQSPQETCPTGTSDTAGAGDPVVEAQGLPAEISKQEIHPNLSLSGNDILFNGQISGYYLERKADGGNLVKRSDTFVFDFLNPDNEIGEFDFYSGTFYIYIASDVDYGDRVLSALANSYFDSKEKIFYESPYDYNKEVVISVRPQGYSIEEFLWIKSSGWFVRYIKEDASRDLLSLSAQNNAIRGYYADYVPGSFSMSRIPGAEKDFVIGLSYIAEILEDSDYPIVSSDGSLKSISDIGGKVAFEKMVRNEVYGVLTADSFLDTIR